MEELLVFLVCVLCFIAGFGFGFVGEEEKGYRNGQLDYQNGVIKYEVTENGYKELVEVD